MVRTATLDLNSRGSFVDDLNSKPGIVMCRDALLHRSHEIQPAFFDSEWEKLIFFQFFSFFFHFFCQGGDLAASAFIFFVRDFCREVKVSRKKPEAGKSQVAPSTEILFFAL